MAGYGAQLNQGKSEDEALQFVADMLANTAVQDPSAADALATFSSGKGDVLISYENEAINIERQGKPVEHINPPQTFKIENPVAVVTSSAHQEQANALKNFLYTSEGQKIWAQAGFRPVDPSVAEDFATDFPTPEKLWSIADLGGWDAVDPKLFDKENGTITKIYKQATG